MKYSKRSVPLDILSFEHKGFRVSVIANPTYLAITVSKDGEEIHNQHMAPEQFISLLMRDPKP